MRRNRMLRNVQIIGMLALVIFTCGFNVARATPLPQDPNSGITSDGRIIDSHLIPKIIPYAHPVSAQALGELRRHTNPNNDEQPDRIIGTDDRWRITDTTQSPYRAVVYFSGGRRCTGFFYKNNTIATAGHCVYDSGTWQWPTSVVPAKNGSSQPYGTCRATNLLAATGWINSRDQNYDWGAMKVDCTGHPDFVLTVASDGLLNGAWLYLTGYPSDHEGEMWIGSGSVTSVATRTIRYNIDMVSGQSGSPVWTVGSGGIANAYAINTAEFAPPTDNQGVRITQDVYNTLQSY